MQKKRRKRKTNTKKRKPNKQTKENLQKAPHKKHLT